MERGVLSRRFRATADGGIGQIGPRGPIGQIEIGKRMGLYGLKERAAGHELVLICQLRVA